MFDDVRGVRETKEVVQRLANQSRPPIALVGSSNTVLTVALAEALSDSARQAGRGGPVLLVPWATAVLAERDEPGQGPVALLDIHPGRTFRFCPNNQTQADLLTRALVQGLKDEVPERVDFIVDRYDPYSLDLSDCFRRAIERRFPTAELVEHGEMLVFPEPGKISGLPSAADEALAETIWRAAEKTETGKSHWVVLPLQSEPARRMLLALRRHAPRQTATGESFPLRVLCGDGIGADTLAWFAGRVRYSIWCYSPGSALEPETREPPPPIPCFRPMPPYSPRLWPRCSTCSMKNPAGLPLLTTCAGAGGGSSYPPVNRRLWDARSRSRRPGNGRAKTWAMCSSSSRESRRCSRSHRPPPKPGVRPGPSRLPPTRESHDAPAAPR